MRDRITTSSGLYTGGLAPCHTAEDGNSGEAVQREAAGRFACAVKAGYHLATIVEHFAAPADPEAC